MQTEFTALTIDLDEAAEFLGFHNTEKLYVYNRDNPISDDKKNQNLQWSIHEEINNKPSFKLIENYK